MFLRLEMEKCNTVKECKEKITQHNNIFKNGKENVKYIKIFNDILRLTDNKGVFSDWVDIGLSWFTNKQIRQKYSDEDWVDFIQTLYMNGEFNREEYDIRNYIIKPNKYFKKDKKLIDSLRVCDDKEMYRRLNNTVKVYRGICIDKNDKLNEVDLGCSWSLERKVGIWFSRRFYEFVKDCKCYLISGYINKEDIIMCIDSVDEKEVVVSGEIKEVEIKEILGKRNIGSWRDVVE